MDNYSRIRLLTDKYTAEGVGTGATGYIIETYPNDAYEVEFSDKNGNTIAQFAVQGGEIALAEPSLISA